MPENDSPAASSPPSRGNRMWRVLILVAAVVVVSFGLLLAEGYSSQQRNGIDGNSAGSDSSSAPPTPASTPVPTRTINPEDVKLPPGVPDVGRGYVVGSNDAPRKMVIWADPECPACADNEYRTYALIRDAIQQDKVQVEYMVLATDRVGSGMSTLALACAAEQGAFVQMRLNLYANQLPEDDLGFYVDDVAEIAEVSGVKDMQAFNACINEERYADYIYGIIDEGIENEIASTPTVLLNGQPLVLERVGFYGFIEALGLDPQDYPVDLS